MFNKAWFFSTHDTPIRILFDTNKSALTTIYLLVSVAEKTTKYYFNNFWQVQLLSGWVVEANELCANVMNCLSLTFVWCPNGYCIWHIHLFLMFDRIRIEFSVHVQSIIFVYARKYVQRKENAWIVKVFLLYLLHAYFALCCRFVTGEKKERKVPWSRKAQSIQHTFLTKGNLLWQRIIFFRKEKRKSRPSKAHCKHLDVHPILVVHLIN